MKWILAAIALSLGGREVCAQKPGALSPGIRVRATIISPVARVHVGTLESLTDSVLYLQAGGASLPIRIESLSTLERTLGRKPNVLGGVLGLVLGGVAGGALGCLANRDSYGVFCGGQSDTKVAVGVALGAVAGAVVGAFVFRRERWNQVDLAILRAL